MVFAGAKIQHWKHRRWSIFHSWNEFHLSPNQDIVSIIFFSILGVWKEWRMVNEETHREFYMSKRKKIGGLWGYWINLLVSFLFTFTINAPFGISILFSSVFLVASSGIISGEYLVVGSIMAYHIKNKCSEDEGRGLVDVLNGKINGWMYVVLLLLSLQLLSELFCGGAST